MTFPSQSENKLMGTVIVLREDTKSGVSNSLRPGGHKRHTMTSSGPGRLMGPKRVPWLDYREFKI